MQHSLALPRLNVINDFTALALALTHLPASAKRAVGGADAVAAPDAAIGLIGPGTGLGVSGLLPLGYQNKWIPISGEGGHVTLSATTQAGTAGFRLVGFAQGPFSAVGDAKTDVLVKFNIGQHSYTNATGVA